MSTSTLFKKPWKKNWVGNWGMLFCCFYGEIYTRIFQKSLRKKFVNTVLACSPVSSAQYLRTDELSAMGKYLAKKIIEKPSTGKQWCKEVIRQTDAILELMKRLERQKEFTFEDYVALRDAMYRHVPHNFAVKRVADYLPKNILIRMLPSFAEVRVYTEPVYIKAEQCLRLIIASIAKKEKMSLSLALCMTQGEIERYFQHGALPRVAVLKTRTKGVLLWYHNGRQTIIAGREAIRAKKMLDTPVAESTIQGVTAYPGKVKGVVRVVLDPRHIKTFNQGDILVTGMTRPEYLTLMKKSAGFVTDAGGMLSHAAIVARELKKPCIVGTEIASKVLKDGDLVEVDATRGVVKIVK